jgi:hypothetical protein
VAGGYGADGGRFAALAGELFTNKGAPCVWKKTFGERVTIALFSACAAERDDMFGADVARIPFRASTKIGVAGVLEVEDITFEDGGVGLGGVSTG